MIEVVDSLDAGLELLELKTGRVLKVSHNGITRGGSASRVVEGTVSSKAGSGSSLQRGFVGCTAQ